MYFVMMRVVLIDVSSDDEGCCYCWFHSFVVSSRLGEFRNWGFLRRSLPSGDGFERNLMGRRGYNGRVGDHSQDVG